MTAQRIRLQIDYNAPFVLSFTLLCLVSLTLDVVTGGWAVNHLFSVDPGMSWVNPVSYLRLVLHTVGHAGGSHLIANLTVILLIGPLIEEKYGTWPLATMALITALVTGLLNVLFASRGLLGSSGIAFMLIMLSSFTNVKSGRLPLTFVLVAILYLGNEFFRYFGAKADGTHQVSHITHILGGVCGSIFGYLRTKAERAVEPLAIDPAGVGLPLGAAEESGAPGPDGADPPGEAGAGDTAAGP